MNQPHETALRAAETYESYLVPSILAPWAQVLIQRAGLQAGDRVLDVACGTGIVARQAAPVVGARGTVGALDSNPAMLAVASSLPAPAGATVAWHEGSALALPFPDAACNVVLCQQ